MNDLFKNVGLGYLLSRAAKTLSGGSAVLD
jgi:excinuclease UvrABC ATPase subunit